MEGKNDLPPDKSGAHHLGVGKRRLLVDGGVVAGDDEVGEENSEYGLWTRR